MKSHKWKKLLTMDSSQSIDFNRKKMLMYIFNLFGGTVMLFYAITSNNSSELELVLYSGCAVLYSNALAFNFHKKIGIATVLTGMVVIPLVLTVVYSGGHANTGLYWVFPFPISFFVFFGPFRGLVLNVLLFLAIIFALYQPNLILADYRPEEVSRFIPAYSVNIILCFLAEYFRSKSHKELSIINLARLKQANTDSLTNLPNRRFIDSVFLGAAKNDHQSYFPMTIVAVDIDHFKKINDAYGHDTGDMVLKHIAKLFRKNTRELDVVARVGGEEFLIIFPKTSKATGVRIADKIRDIVSKTPYRDNEITIPIAISLGSMDVSKYIFIDEAIKKADKLLYRAKQLGRNRLETEPAIKP